MNDSTRRVILFISLFFIFSGMLFAQGTGTVAGRVVDALTNDPLPSANIVIQDPFLGTITDLNGDFILNNVPVGSQTIHVSYMGYQEQEFTLDIVEGETQTLNASLEVLSIMGEEVVVTAQVYGQRAAINQQFAALTVKNVVSAEKIEELPDANAAEAIGRLPGISLKRSSGEADKIVIRGLSPKYNNITIEGIKMASTSDYDRSVDLSLVQSELLSGIEVTKSLTPDMDADALGGTVNLRLLEAPNVRKASFVAEGGYANIAQDFGNYKFTGSFSDRFFDKKLGFSLKASHERKQMPSHRFSGGYSGAEWQFKTDPDNPSVIIDSSLIVRTQDATLIDRQQTRKRTNGSLILDFRNNWWEMKFFNLLSIKNDDVWSRDSRYLFDPQGTAANFQHTVRDEEWRTMTRTHTLQNTFRFGSSKLDLDLSHTYAQVKQNEQYFPLIEINDYQLNQNSLIYAQPSSVLDRVGGPDSLKIEESYLQEFNLGHRELLDKSYDAKLDYELSYAFGSISGKLQLGGKFHQLTRSSDGALSYYNFQWGGSVARRQTFVTRFPWIQTDMGAQRGINALNFVDKGYDPGTFLDGRYKLGWTANIDMLTAYQDTVHTEFGPESDRNLYYVRGVESYRRDYETTERLMAGYIMTEINLGRRVTVLPGVRYERMETEYQAWHVNTNSGATGIEPNPDSVVTNRLNMHWFPSVNIKYKATDFISIQGAVYKSTTRPSFRQVSPFVRYARATGSYAIESNNPYLEPAKAWNYDLGVSVMQPKVGLFTVYGFYKQIDDLVFVMNDYKPAKKGVIIGGPEDLDDRILGAEYYNPLLLTDASITDLPFNNTEKATVMGVELSWQTNFWYLPGALKGLVLDINYTILDTKTKYPYFQAVIIDWDESGFIPVPIYGQYYRTRPGPMEDQPNSILNVILGWDFKGFSSRISYRYQSETVESLDARYSVFDSYYDSFTLIDLMLKQQITKNLSVYANLTNIGNHIDDYYFGEQGEGKPALPTSSQFYGFRAQLGVKLNL
jgi:TonB-dependent receptor